MRFALVDADGNVLDLVEWDGKAEFAPGPGLTLRKAKPTDRPVDVADAPEPTPVTLDDTTADELADTVRGANTLPQVKAAILDVIDALREAT